MPGSTLRKSVSSMASTQNSAPSVFDSRHTNTARLTQSIAKTLTLCIEIDTPEFHVSGS